MSNETLNLPYDQRKYGFKQFVESAFDRDAFEIDSKAFDSSTGGINNEIFGAVVYNQLNLESNMYGVFPKMDAQSMSGDVQGFRTASAAPSLNFPAEGASVGADSNSTHLEANPEVKRTELVQAASRLYDLEAQLEDDVPFSALTAFGQATILDSVEANGLGAGVTAGGSAYSATDSITSLDRVIASGGEEGDVDDVAGSALTDGDLDVYGFNRSANEFESYVDYNGSAGAATDRDLTEALMDDFIASWEEFGTGSREDAVILTGYDTAQELSSIQDNSGLYRISLDGDEGREDVNDASTRWGTRGISEARAYKGIPVIPSKNMFAHGTISDILILDMSEGEVYGDGQARPKIYIEEYDTPYVERAGRGQSQGYLATGTYEEQVLVRYDHEIVCTDAGAQGKLRDLQAA